MPTDTPRKHRQGGSILTLGWAAFTLALFAVTAAPVSAQTRRVRLEILVLTAGDTGTQSIMAGLDEGLVPYTVVDLNESGRPNIDAAFLVDSPARGVTRGKYQAVVLPNDAPYGLGAAELAALHAYEREFGIRQLDTYIYPSPAVGLNWPANPGYIGPLDGVVAQVNLAGLDNGFGGLVGPVPFDDLSPVIDESYGYLATPLASQGDGRTFTPFVEMSIPGTEAQGVLVGVLGDGGREEMVITAAMNQYQLQQQLLFTGVLNWLTYGVHLGHERNYLSVHIDDVFVSDARWVTDANCTSGDDCPAELTVPDILMTPDDVDYLQSWQQTQGIKLDLAFNGAGHDEASANAGGYPLGETLISNRNDFRWINHTYSHLNLGCLKDHSVSPWRCATDSNGATLWRSYEMVYDEINLNIEFAREFGIQISRGELVTGEHSGIRRAPEEPSDNPNLARAIDRLNIDWAGSDNSRETQVRALGNARTVPRHPMSIYYNVGTVAEEIDEYNWIYTSVANGGSGICEINPLSTCIAPLDPVDGFADYIVPSETRATLLHMLGNSPKPHYAHQSNLAEDRILYPVLDGTLAQYRALFTNDAQVINPTLTESGQELARHQQWPADRPKVEAYVQAGKLHVSHSGGYFTRLNIPITLPAEEAVSEPSGGLFGGLFGFLWGGLTGVLTGDTGESEFEAYGVTRSGWDEIRGSDEGSYDLPESVGYPR